MSKPRRHFESTRVLNHWIERTEDSWKVIKPEISWNDTELERRYGSYYQLRHYVGSFTQSFIIDIICEADVAYYKITAIVTVNHLEALFGESEHHRSWALEYKGVRYENQNRDFYTFAAYSRIEFMIQRNGTEGVSALYGVNLYNLVHHRSYMNMTIPCRTGVIRRRMVTMTALTGVEPIEEVVDWVQWYAERGIDVALYLFAPFDGLEEAITRMHVTRRVRIYHWFWFRNQANQIRSLCHALQVASYYRLRLDYTFVSLIPYPHFMTFGSYTVKEISAQLEGYVTTTHSSVLKLYTRCYIQSTSNTKELQRCDDYDCNRVVYVLHYEFSGLITTSQILMGRVFSVPDNDGIDPYRLLARADCHSVSSYIR